MRKKTLAVLLLVMLMLATVASAEGLPYNARVVEQQETAITEEAALEIARPVWLETVGTVDDWDKYIEYVTTFIEYEHEGAMRPAWACTVYDRNAEHDSCLVIVDAETGDVLRTEAFVWYYLDQEHQANNNARWFWSLEDKQTYFNLYIKNSFDPSHDSLPGPDHVDEETARGIAADALAEYCGLTAEKIATLREDVAFYEYVEIDDVYADNSGTDNWIFAYRPLLPDPHGEYTLLYQVTLSAEDGSLMLVADEHYILYPPQDNPEPGKG